MSACNLSSRSLRIPGHSLITPVQQGGLPSKEQRGARDTGDQTEQYSLKSVIARLNGASRLRVGGQTTEDELALLLVLGESLLGLGVSCTEALNSWQILQAEKSTKVEKGRCVRSSWHIRNGHRLLDFSTRPSPGITSP